MGLLGGAGAGKIYNTYLIDGAGGDIWGNTDDFGFFYQSRDIATLEGTVKFPGVTGTLADNAKVGLMYRETLANNSRFYCIVKRKDGIILAMARTVTGGPVNIYASYNFGQNIDKFKIEKTANLCKSYYYNGSAWVDFNTENIIFATGGKVGFCFALMGELGICYIDGPILSGGEIVVSKPLNLIGKIVQIASATTPAGGGQTNDKPLNLIGKIVQIASAGDPSGNTGAKVPTTGFSVLSFGWKEGLFYSQSQAKTQQMKLTADVNAQTITDEAWNYNPPMWNNATNSMVTPYRAWKINDCGEWKTIALTNVDVSVYVGQPITVTKIFYFVNEFTKAKMFQQIIQLF